ncbi:MAG TPA: hypothetical protein VK011_08680 [Acidimicrobiia bacterium]|nr:hypothetical protein [Acidimicrobiia bacterium]
MNEAANGGPRVEDVRASIAGRRREIADTISEIERRLRPDRLRRMATDRLYDATAVWRENPVGQLEAWGRDALTRLREMAWMNPVGLGLAAFAAGWLTGRRRRRVLSR